MKQYVTSYIPHLRDIVERKMLSIEKQFNLVLSQCKGNAAYIHVIYFGISLFFNSATKKTIGKPKINTNNLIILEIAKILPPKYYKNPEEITRAASPLHNRYGEGSYASRGAGGGGGGGRIDARPFTRLQCASQPGGSRRHRPRFLPPWYFALCSGGCIVKKVDESPLKMT